MFRNARLYRFKGDWPESEEAVSGKLGKNGFRACGPLTERSSGWVGSNPDSPELLARRLNGADLLKLRSQSRVLPAAAINEALEEKVDAFRARMQEEPGRREKRRLKAETRTELLPKALLKSDRTWGYVDPGKKLIAIDAAQAARAERFLDILRIPFDTLTIRPLRYKQPVGDLLNRIFLGDAPEQFTLGRECRMQDATEAGSTVRWNDFDLSDTTIRKHVADGMRLTHLGIEYAQVLRCVIDEHGALSKLRFLGMDDKETMPDNDPLGRQDAQFVLLSGTLREFIGQLEKLLDGFE